MGIIVYHSLLLSTSKWLLLFKKVKVDVQITILD